MIRLPEFIPDACVQVLGNNTTGVRRDRILAALREHGWSTTAWLAEHLGYGAQSLVNDLKVLERAGLVESRKQRQGRKMWRALRQGREGE